MRDLDETDREILRLLLEDARRPYSDIADVVDLSAPAVSDRVDRLQEVGLIRGFTVDIDRDLLAAGTPVLVTVTAEPGAAEEVQTALAAADRVEHTFRTVDGTVVATATLPGKRADSVVADLLPMDAVATVDVRLLGDREWQPRLGEASLAPACVECGNTVSTEGEQSRVDGELYHFCCQSCQQAFLDRYERFSEEA